MTTVTAFLTALSTLMTIYITYASWNLDTKIKVANTALQQAIEGREDRQARENFNLQVYEKVWAALQTEEKRKHEVAYALVQSLDDDNTLKGRLLDLFQTPVVSQETREAASVARFQIDQQQRDAAQSGVNYDVFWCEEPREGSISRRGVAVDAATKIRGQSGVGRVRVRMLPGVLNRQEKRFNVSGLVIRKDPDEENRARQLKEWIDLLSPPKGFTVEANLGPPSPNYLSVFVCGT